MGWLSSWVTEAILNNSPKETKNRNITRNIRVIDIVLVSLVSRFHDKTNFPTRRAESCQRIM